MARLPRPVEHRSHHTRPWGRAAIAAAILALAAGCSAAPQADAPAPSPSAIAPSAAPSAAPAALAPSSLPADRLGAAHRRLQARARRLVPPADPVAVDLYTLNATCDAYQVEPVLVPRPQSMETTVAWILAEQTIPDLALSGYRTRFDPATKTVTIDLRVARTSRRVLQSLSMCEQRALLGSLRETLIHQPDWQIAAVVFTNRGNPLEL